MNKQKDILNNWLTEIKENPHFSEQSIQQNKLLKNYSESFLSNIFQTMQDKDISAINKKNFEPILELWHQLIKEQLDKGFTTKDTAVLIYALKTSLSKHLPTQTSPENIKKTQQLEDILDLLGMLIFEMYTAEKENLISRQNEHIQYLQSATQIDNNFIGNSPAMKHLFKAMSLVLENDITVLLEGESGTGKDLIATIIHTKSSRKHKNFVAINCAAIPKELIESELFGHEKGAFTGADERKIGKCELADNGTLFLDEIGEMPIDLQVKLLRTLQNKEIERVGGTAPIPINTRIIAATNQNLKQQVDEKKFRLDLYYRLNVYPIQVPPLRERKEDILPLSIFFIERYNKQFNLKSGPLTKDAEHFLNNHVWEGNIRELENTIQRGVILAQSTPITANILALKPGEIEEPSLLLESHAYHIENSSLKEDIIPLADLEKKAILHALRKTSGNIQKASKALNISRTTFYNKLEKYKIIL